MYYQVIGYTKEGDMERIYSTDVKQFDAKEHEAARDEAKALCRTGCTMVRVLAVESAETFYPEN